MPFVQENDANYPKLWAGIVTSNARTDNGPKRVGTDGTVSATVASTAAVAAPGPRPQIAAARIPVEPAIPVPVSVRPPTMPMDLAQINPEETDQLDGKKLKNFIAPVAMRGQLTEFLCILARSHNTHLAPRL